MKRRTPGLAAVTLLALATVPAAYAGGTETSYAKPLSADAVYLGGAFLMGLAALAAVLGVGVAAGKMERSYLVGIGAYFMVGGAILAAMAQGAAMLHACCYGFPYTPYDFVIPTISGTLLIMVGAGMIATKRFVVAPRDGGRPARGKTEGGA